MVHWPNGFVKNSVFTELFLSNITIYGKHDTEWQTSIQGMSLSDFVDYLRKREGSFKNVFVAWYEGLSEP